MPEPVAELDRALAGGAQAGGGVPVPGVDRRDGLLQERQLVTVPVPVAKLSSIKAFGIEYQGKTGLSKSEFSWAA